MREQALNHALTRYESTPHLVFWEMTKACGLACRHCRASAQTTPLPGELSTAEGRDLIDQIAAMPGHPPILILTGGDCFTRPDLEELVSYARERQVRVGVAPSVTPLLTRDAMQRLYDLGVRSVSISLDGSTPETHDGIRGIPGHFERTMDALDMLAELGFRLQVNTTVMNRNVTELAGVLRLLEQHQVGIWEVFFLVGVGRGVELAEVTPAEAEDVCHFLVDATERGETVRTVEAPFFRRVQAERREAPGDPRDHFLLGPLYDRLRDELSSVDAPRATPTRSHSLATGDGRGIVFVGYDGEVHASGFLPQGLGNVRVTPLAEIYGSHEVLTTIRTGALEGECGRCDYRRLCGGSRARAFAHFGRVLAEDPACVRTDAARRTHLAVR